MENLTQVDTIHGRAKAMYYRMKDRVKEKYRNRGLGLSFSFEEFETFVKGSDIEMLVKNYIDSGRRMALTPSVDRIDNSRGYDLDNIRIITYGENARKGAKYEQKYPAKPAGWRKKKYVISLLGIEESKRVWDEDRGFGIYPKRKGYIPVWDRNNRNFVWFKVVEQYTDTLAYIVERGWVPMYWRNIIKRYPQSSKEPKE